MKIFISYGHDHNKPIVDRIERDLKAAGYEVWKDEIEIRAGDHWRRSILDGVKDSDWVLGFLSKHSVRDPGVCLDELDIALHEKGGAIATVLLEGEAGAPVSVSHIQWLDMHDWAERQAAGAAAFESWYRAKFDELIALLAKADPNHSGWQRALSVSYAKLAYTYRKAAQPTQAREALAAGHAIIARLVAQFPDWSQWKQDLAWFDRQIAELSQ